MIDIIMPCFNAEKYIEETIRSVLSQTEMDFKLICVDDGSDDSTYSILMRMTQQDKRIVALKNHENCGIAATRNRGIKEGKAEYIAFLDDDDIMPVDRLQICKDYLDNHPDVGVIAGNYLIFDMDGNRKTVLSNRFYSATEVRAILPFVNIIPNGSTLIRRGIVEQNNIFFHEEYGIEDYHFYAEISKVADINVLPEVLLEHRVMATQYSAECINSEQIFKKRQDALDRVHKKLIYSIVDDCDERDIVIYTRFMQENIKNIKLKELLGLYFVMQRFKRSVKSKGNVDYKLFRKEADYVVRRSVRAYAMCSLDREKYDSKRY